MAISVTSSEFLTPLYQNEALSLKTGIPGIYIKDEGAHLHGTWKDRRSRRILQETRDQTIDTFCLITSGNAGYSLGQMSQGTGMNVVAIVDNTLPEPVTAHLRKACTNVIGVDLSQKFFGSAEIVRLVEGDNSSSRVLDVTNGYHAAYEDIIYEIAVQMDSVQPKYILCPVGSGEAFFGMYQGLNKLGWSTKLIGVSPMSRPSFADKLHTPWTPYQSYFGDMINEGHRIVLLDEHEIRVAYEAMKSILPSEPSSAITYGALCKVKISPADIVVMIHSGNGEPR